MGVLKTLSKKKDLRSRIKYYMMIFRYFLIGRYRCANRDLKFLNIRYGKIWYLVNKLLWIVIVWCIIMSLFYTFDLA